MRIQLDKQHDLEPDDAIRNLAVICDQGAKHAKALHHACLALGIDDRNDEYWHVFQALLRKLGKNPEVILDTSLVAQTVLSGLSGAAASLAFAELPDQLLLLVDLVDSFEDAPGVHADTAIDALVKPVVARQ